MRRSIIGIAAVLGLVALGGCSSGDDGSAATSTPAEATTEATSPPSDTATGGAGTLVVWVDDTRSGPVAEVAKVFEAERGVTVELVNKDFGEIRDDFISQAPTGKGPDIIVGAHDWLGKLVQNGVVEPVELGERTQEFLPVSLSALSSDGVLYGLPYSVENIGLVRNNALAASTPATFDELVAAGQQLVAEGKATYPVLIQQDEVAGDPYHLYPLQTSFGAPVFGTDDSGSYDPAQLLIGNDGGQAFATYLAKLGQEGVMKSTISGDIAKEAFLAGESAWMITGPWNTGDFVKAGLDIAIEPIPSAGGQPSQPFVGVQGFFISSQSPNKLLANEFVVNYLGTPDVQMAMYEAGGRAPAMSAALDELTSDPIVSGFAAVGENGVPMPSIPEMDTVWSDWGATEVAIINQTGDPVALWQQMAASIQSKITG